MGGVTRGAALRLQSAVVVCEPAALLPRPPRPWTLRAGAVDAKRRRRIEGALRERAGSTMVATAAANGRPPALHLFTGRAQAG